MAKAKSKESKLSFETDFEEAEESRLKIRPEDIVRFKEENNGTLPEEYSPYGQNYKIERSKFLNDTEPCPQFREDGSRRWEVINEGDANITPVYFSLPEPPKDFTLIDGYDREKDDQYFRRVEIPKKFKLIEAKALKDLAEIEKKNRQDTIQGYKFYIRFWEIVEEEEENLVDEIEWLKKIWWFRTYGYWYFNDGEPTFLPPDYFDFLNFYFIDEAVCYPEFRDDIRRKFCYARYLESCTETFRDLDDTGKAVKNEKGSYDMIDLGRRLFFGDVEPKTRRTGATHEAVHKILLGAMTNLSYFSTIISFEGNNAETHYKKKLLPAFDAYPMVLKPIWEGNRRPTILRLDAPPNVYSIRGLKSAIAFSDSGGVFANDGDRLNGVLNDEQGKQSNLKIDIFERWHVNKYTMSTGMGVNILKGAYVKNPSTVEQLESGSVPYYKLCMMSNFYHRVPIKGQTSEGFARIFLPAFLRLEGYIDRFGKSVVETPTERQCRLSPMAIFSVSKKGAKETMQAERDALLQINTPESLEAYRSIRRKSPFEWAECWLGGAGNVGYNLEIVDKRLGELGKDISLGKAPYKTGFFYRENPTDPHSRVLWETSTEKIKFRMSMDLPAQLSNQREGIEVWDGLSQKTVMSWRPRHGQRFTCGIDPFRNLSASQSLANKKEGFTLSSSRQSDGGIAILWEYDESIDRGKEKKNWESFKCILSYRYRPSTQEEYFEDVIMACQYYGAMMYPEQNVEAFIAHVYKRGYGGYFLFDMGIDGRPRPLPGRWTGTETQQDIIREYKDYIEFRGHKENHDDLLQEVKQFKGSESFTRLDLKTAFGFALLGSKSRYRELLGQPADGGSIDLSGFGLFSPRNM
jgi:hypothetical protein